MRLHWTRLVSPLLVVMWTASLSGCVFISAAINPFGQRPEPLQEHVVSGEGKDKILLLDISHVISADEQQGELRLEQRNWPHSDLRLVQHRQYLPFRGRAIYRLFRRSVLGLRLRMMEKLTWVKLLKGCSLD